MPQLDALRAVAVLAVLTHHYLVPSFIESVTGASLGLLGVRLFFVLSGFLITGILLRARQAVEQGLATRSGALKQFYIRRALRIFPLYYFVLLIALIFGDHDAREQLPWLATYTYNFWIAWLGWYPSYFSHFWSLAIEEQFYVLWPAAILLAPRRILVPMLIFVIAVAPIYRGIAWTLAFEGMWFNVATPSSVDALGVGALLAVLAGGQSPSRFVTRAMIPVGAIGAIGWVLVIQDRAYSAVLLETVVALVFMWIVAGAAAGFRGPVRHVIEAAPVLYLGKISYGVYVYHLFLPDVAKYVLGLFGFVLDLKGIPYFLTFTAVTIAVASLSWYAFEKPMNDLKRRFPYPARAALAHDDKIARYPRDGAR